VCSVPTEVPVAERARWLAEVSDALDQAHQLLSKFDVHDDRRPETLDLYVRIEAARLEVQSLRLSRSLRPRADSAPQWTEFAPWQSDELGSG
jgi:hypothetical protein